MTKKDKAFMQWKARYDRYRPGAKEEVENSDLVIYAEDSLESAFEAGWEACKEAVEEL